MAGKTDPSERLERQPPIMASIGSLKLILSARLEGNEPHDVGTINLPIEVREQVGDFSASVNIDAAELQRRIKEFSLAVSEEAARALDSDVLRHPPERMIGSALALDPCPEFEARLRAAKTHHSLIDRPGLLDGPEHVIIGGRQEGKTRLALKWLTEAPDGVERVLIVMNGSMAEHMKRDLGFTRADPRIISYRTLLNKGGRRGVEYGVDETVAILTELLGLHEFPRLLTVSHAEAWQG